MNSFGWKDVLKVEHNTPDVTILTQNEAIIIIGAALRVTGTGGGGRAPMASFWVRIVTSCMNIKGSA